MFKSKRYRIEGSVNGEQSIQSSESARFIKFLLRKGLPTDDKDNHYGRSINNHQMASYLWLIPSTIKVQNNFILQIKKHNDLSTAQVC